MDLSDVVVTHSNVRELALFLYDSPGTVSEEEFNEDFNRFKYVKKLLNRYLSTGDLKERLILNHFIVLTNVFGKNFVVKVVYLKMLDNLPQVKPFLEMLGILPKYVTMVGSRDVLFDTDDVVMDQNVVRSLRTI